LDRIPKVFFFGILFFVLFFNETFTNISFYFLCRSGDFWMIELRRYSSKFFVLWFFNETLLTFRLFFFLGLRLPGDFWVEEFRRYLTSKFFYFYFFFNETLLTFRFIFFLQVGWLLDDRTLKHIIGKNFEGMLRSSLSLFLFFNECY